MLMGQKRNRDQLSIYILLLRSLPYSQIISLIAEVIFILCAGNLVKYEWQRYEQQQIEMNLSNLIIDSEDSVTDDIHRGDEGFAVDDGYMEEEEVYYNPTLSQSKIEEYLKQIEDMEQQKNLLKVQLSSYSDQYKKEQLRIVTGGAIKFVQSTGDEPYRIKQDDVYKTIMALQEKINKIQSILYSDDSDVATLEEIGVNNNRTVDETSLRKYQALIDLNEDFYGWLTIEGTKIDLPVVMCEDNDDYLYQDFYKEDNRYGTLFLDCDSRIKKQPRNLIIYGHNMKDGSMFHDLLNYKDKSFYEAHKTFIFDTIYGQETYEVVSAFYSKVYAIDEEVFKYYKYVNPKKSEMEVFTQEIKKLSRYDTGVNATNNDVYVTLSTCAYHTDNGRFVVIARRLNE